MPCVHREEDVKRVISSFKVGRESGTQHPPTYSSHQTMVATNATTSPNTKLRPLPSLFERASFPPPNPGGAETVVAGPELVDDGSGLTTVCGGAKLVSTGGVKMLVTVDLVTVVPGRVLVMPSVGGSVGRELVALPPPPERVTETAGISKSSQASLYLSTSSFDALRTSAEGKFL